jgi:hypothetical protein
VEVTKVIRDEIPLSFGGNPTTDDGGSGGGGYDTKRFALETELITRMVWEDGVDDEGERQSSARHAGLEAVRALLNDGRGGRGGAEIGGVHSNSVGVGGGQRQGVVSGKIAISDIDQIALTLMEAPRPQGLPDRYKVLPTPCTLHTEP